MQGAFTRTHVAVLILLIAAYLRFVDIGAEPFFADQAKIGVQALDVARGKWDLLGPAMAIGSLRHSPLTIYMYALPYRLVADPRPARLFTGLMNILAVAVVYLIGSRYFDQKAGLIAGLLYAIYPAAVQGSRFVWNQNLAAPFVMLYILTGLLGYCENKKLARAIHLPMLSLAGQCHPSLFLLAPLSIMCWVYAWRYQVDTNRRVVGHTIISGLLALLLLLPWCIGLYQHLKALGPETEITAGTNGGFMYMAHIVYTVLARGFSGYALDNPTQPFLAVLTLVAAPWLTMRGLLRRDGFPGLLIALGWFVVPTLVWLLSSHYWDHHIWPLLGNATLIQGAFLGGLRTSHPAVGRWARVWNWRGFLNDRHMRWLALPGLAAIILPLMYAHIKHDKSESMNSLNQNLAVLRTAQDVAQQTNRELLLLSFDPPHELRCVGCRGWETLPLILGNDIRVIWDTYGLPLPSNGALLLGTTTYSGRPFVFSQGHIVHEWFRLVDLPGPRYFEPDLVPLEPIRLSNGATILGFRREQRSSMPTAGKTWTAFMIWRTETQGTHDYKVFAHLIDETGSPHAQVDPPGLPANQWRPDEHVMSRLEFEVDQSMPESGALYLRFGMYNDEHHAQVLDKSTNPRGTMAILQIRSDSPPLARWNNGLELAALLTGSPVQQGPPLEVIATWHASLAAAVDNSLRWRLAAQDSTLAFETTTNLLPSSSVSVLPSGVFVTEQYSLRIATDLQPGDYELELQLLDKNGVPTGDPLTSSVTLLTRERSFYIPAVQHALTATLGNKIELVGYDLMQNGGRLQIVLHWHALGPIDRDYKYFVHLWHDGRVVAQTDSMPASYRYPTSWWAPGEVFSDFVSVDVGNLEPGAHDLTVGLYDPSDGERLPVTTVDGSPTLNGWIGLQTIHLD